jgi:uncharacterized protein (TIGR02145 family)
MSVNIGTSTKHNAHSYPLLDKDGNEYTTVVIGNQEWIVENLKTTHYADGTLIPNLTLATGSGIHLTDWLLPNINLLNAMYTNLHLNNIGNFNITQNYWSSTVFDSISSWSKNFSTGTSAIENKNASERVRAYRIFTSSTVYNLRDNGPSGGWIFYIDGSDYYETAPYDCVSLVTWNNAENLCYNFDVLIPGGWSGDTTGAMCYYDNDINNKVPYGVLYNRYAVDNAHGIVYFERNGVQESGWKLPLYADLWQLISFLGVDVAGGKLKETGLTHWNTPNLGATNEVGFTAVGSGWRAHEGSFAQLKDVCYIHSTMQDSQHGFIGPESLIDEIGFWGGGDAQTEKWGGTVRCVRDI